MTGELALFLAILFFSALFRSTFGFGDALVAMSLLALAFPVKFVTPIVAVSGLLISLAILIKERKSLKLSHLWHIIAACIVGIPLGLLFLKNVPNVYIKLALALILILFAAFRLAGFSSIRLRSDRYAWAFGLISGALGAVYNTNGPPIIIYGSLRQWSKGDFRLNLQSIFFPTNLFIIVGHLSSGLWHSSNFVYMLWALPAIAIAIVVGNYLHSRLRGRDFDRYTLLFILALGIILLGNTIYIML